MELLYYNGVCIGKRFLPMLAFIVVTSLTYGALHSFRGYALNPKTLRIPDYSYTSLLTLTLDLSFKDVMRSSSSEEASTPSHISHVPGMHSDMGISQNIDAKRP